MKPTNKWTVSLSLVASLFPVIAFADAELNEQVPAITSDASVQSTPPALSWAPSGNIHLNNKEATAVRLARQWRSHPDKPRKGEDGSVVYLFGATLPTMICTPLKVCAIRLQPGEIVNDVHAGDTTNWRIMPATSGEGDRMTTLVTVKPVDAGLMTNLLIATNRRVYSIKLVSAKKDWIPLLAFDYPDEVDAAWTSYRKQQSSYNTATTFASTGQSISTLDFDYSLSGSHPSWEPVRVYTDGIKTYIQFPSSHFYGSEAPALVALNKNSNPFGSDIQELVNYRLIGDRYVVDKVLDRAALISGVGINQVKVIIKRKGH